MAYLQFEDLCEAVYYGELTIEEAEAIATESFENF